MVRKVSLGLVAVIVGFAIYAATRPSTYRVQRAVPISASPEVIYAHLDSFRSWSQWSPWEKLDPHMKKSFEGPDRGVGAAYFWQGNDKVGQGKMTITKSDPPRQIDYQLQFIEPFEAVATNQMLLQPAGADVTNVTWTMDGKNNFMSKVFGIFFNMEETIGADFEQGLAALKQVAETESVKQAKAAAEAQADALAQAAQAARAAEEAAHAAERKAEKATAAAGKKPTLKR